MNNTPNNDTFTTDPAFWTACNNAIDAQDARVVVLSIHALGYDRDIADTARDHVLDVLEDTMSADFLDNEHDASEALIAKLWAN